MKTIQISDELYEKLGSKARPFLDQPEDVIRRLLENELPQRRTRGEASQGVGPREFVHSKGGAIPCPLKLRMVYKGTITYGETKGGFILFEGHQFSAPSPAAEHVARIKGTQNPSIDGWRALEYFDVDKNSWYPLDNLRKKR